MDFFKCEHHIYTFEHFYIFGLKVESGCDCCDVNGKLVPDKQTWVVGDKTYGNNVKFFIIRYLIPLIYESAVEEILLSNRTLKNLQNL